MKTEYFYDSTGGIIRQATTGSANAELLYSYDLNGMLTQERRIEDGKTVTSEYSYDPLGRLSAYTTDRSNGYSESYQYDAVGNMLEKQINDMPIRMTYNAANQLTGMKSENGSVAYTYNVNGDLTGKILDGKYQDSYAYDVSGNLTQYKGYDGYTVNYSYSALNMLTEKVSTGNANRATLEEIISGK